MSRTSNREAKLLAEAREAVDRVLRAPTLVEALGAMLEECGAGTGLLESRRRYLARRCHPDIWSSIGTDEDRSRAHDAMSRVNDAFRILSDAANFRHYLLTEIMRDRVVCPKCKNGAIRKQKGFTRVDLVPCTNCNGVGYVNK